MSKKIRVALLYGGRSTEHEVSLRSARSIYAALDKKKYEPVLIGVDKQGKWLASEESAALLESTISAKQTKEISVPGFSQEMRQAVDVVFPVMHGSYGEDGTMQGLLKLAGVPFVGPSVLGSAVGMDKEVAKRLLRDAGIGIADFILVRKHQAADAKFVAFKRKLGVPMFVKPSNAGSSVGVSKVRNEKEFLAALHTAFKYDTKVLVEQAIEGREIECAVLGNESPQVSIPGEVTPTGHDFYSYESKYLDENGAAIEIPARLSPAIKKKIQKVALDTYQTLCLEGMSRVDVFLTKDNKVIVNEVNTIPGFTSISMYPKLWEASGLAYPKLLDMLITLAIKRYKQEAALSTSLK